MRERRLKLVVPQQVKKGLPDACSAAVKPKQSTRPTPGELRSARDGDDLKRSIKAMDESTLPVPKQRRALVLPQFGKAMHTHRHVQNEPHKTGSMAPATKLCGTAEQITNNSMVSSRGTQTEHPSKPTISQTERITSIGGTTVIVMLGHSAPRNESGDTSRIKVQADSKCPENSTLMLKSAPAKAARKRKTVLAAGIEALAKRRQTKANKGMSAAVGSVVTEQKAVTYTSCPRDPSPRVPSATKAKQALAAVCTAPMRVPAVLTSTLPHSKLPEAGQGIFCLSIPELAGVLDVNWRAPALGSPESISAVLRRVMPSRLQQQHASRRMEPFAETFAAAFFKLSAAELALHVPQQFNHGRERQCGRSQHPFGPRRHDQSQTQLKEPVAAGTLRSETPHIVPPQDLPPPVIGKRNRGITQQASNFQQASKFQQASGLQSGEFCSQDIEFGLPLRTSHLQQLCI